MSKIKIPSPPPILGDIAPHLYVPFPARRLRSASMAWVNWRYFANEGIDVADAEARAKLEQDLLDSFAFCVPCASDDETDFHEGEHILYADRYGGPNGAIYGGSARAAVIGSYIVKGVGRTSLWADGGDKYHSDGHLWLTEAIKDALYSELVWLECPHRSIPTVAIIDTGLTALMPDGDRVARRALLVRPFPVRLAHLERSIHFARPDHPNDQREDAIRVRQLLHLVFDRKGAGPIDNEDLRAIAMPIAQQIGACRFWRLSHDFVSANTAIGGAILDFGGFYGLTNWQRVKREAWLSINQCDLDDVHVSLKAVRFYAAKCFGVNNDVDPLGIVNWMADIADDTFAQELQNQLDVGEYCPEYDIIRSRIIQYFNSSQQQTVDYTFTPPRHNYHGWLGDALNNEDFAPSEEPLSKAEDAIRRLLDAPAHPGPASRAVRARIALALRRRDPLLIEEAEANILCVVKAYERAPSASGSLISRYVEETVTACRRRFSYPVGPFVMVLHVWKPLWDATLFYNLQDDLALLNTRSPSSLDTVLSVDLQRILGQVPSDENRSGPNVAYHVAAGIGRRKWLTEVIKEMGGLSRMLIGDEATLMMLLKND